MELPRTSRAKERTFSLPLLLAIGFVCITGVSAARELYRRERVEQELQTLEQRVTTLQNRKLEVSQILQRLQTADVIDREARLRLNMQKPGERVYVLQGGAWEEQKREDSRLPTLYQGRAPEPSQQNPKRWFRHFFVHSNG